MDVFCLTQNDDGFPDSLRSEIIKPPIEKLWCRGKISSSSFEKCAAVVGSRRMSRYGRQITEEVVARLVEAQFSIVSGLMYGVDQLAHRVCLDSGGKAVGVLGYGITSHNEVGAMKLIEEIVGKNGVVMSEYEGDSVSQRWMFPQRNRIVVGLSQLVIVIEAGLKSGSLITARLANEMGKEVYAIPGPVFSPTSEGTNWLIKNGKAKVLTLDALTEIAGVKGYELNGKNVLKKLNAGEREIYTKMRVEGPQTANEVARALNISVREIVSQLVQMEMKGVVVEERGVWKVN